MWISSSARVLPGCTIGPGSCVADFSIVGHPAAATLRDLTAKLSRGESAVSLTELVASSGFDARTRIGQGAQVRSFCVIYEDVTIGDRLDLAHFVTIREGCTLGADCYLKVGADLRRGVRVGDRATIAGLLGDRSIVGNGSTVLGDLVHRSSGAHRGEIELAPVIEDDVFVGRHSTVIGGVRVGSGAYIASGVTVRRDVPAGAMIKLDW